MDHGEPPSAAVLSGIDLLMNPKMRSGSDVASVVSSVSSASSRHSRHSGHSSASSHRGGHPIEATVANPSTLSTGLPPSFQKMMAGPPPPTPRPVQIQQVRAQQYADVTESASAYGDEDEDEDEENEDDDDDNGDDDGYDGNGSGSQVSGYGGGRRTSTRMSPEETANAKRDILYQFDRIERKGVRLPRRFTMEDSLDDMKAELDRVKIDRELDVSVRFQRKMLMACVTGIELLNNRFDPFEVKLEGWSDSMHESVNDYDEVFEELHMKYRGKAKMAPELKLMFMVGGSGVMFHLTSTMFRQSSMPGLEQVMRQNPGLARQFAQATVNTMQGMPQQQQQQQQQRPSGGGLFGGLLGNLFGGGNKQQPPQQYQQQQQQPEYQYQQQQQQPMMRGPKPIDEILKDMHRGAFPGDSSMQHQHQHQNQHKPDYSSRIEIVSNASESELGDLPEDTASVLGDLGATSSSGPPRGSVAAMNEAQLLASGRAGGIGKTAAAARGRGSRSRGGNK